MDGYKQSIKYLKSLAAKYKNKDQLAPFLDALNSNDLRRAENSIDRLAKERANDHVILTLQGGVKLMIGKRPEAQVAFENAVKLKKDYEPALLYLAKMYTEGANLNEAKKVYESVLLFNDKSSEAMYGLSQIAIQSGNQEEAISWLEKLRTVDKMNVQARVILARYYMQEGRASSALSIVNEAYALKPNEPVVVLSLAQVFLAEKKLDRALDAYQKLAKLLPKNADVYAELAKIQFQLKLFKQSHDSLLQALRLDKNLLSAKVTLAQLEFAQNNIDKAVQLATEIQSQHSNLPIGYAMLGDIRFIQKKYQDAAAEYRKVFELQPSSVAVNKIAEACIYAKQYSKAIEVLEPWLSKNENEVNTRLRLANSYYLSNDKEKASLQYEEVLKHDKD